MGNHFDVVVIGAGAAGIGAGRRLANAGVSYVLLDSRDRIGGRALTIAAGGYPLDLGCGWLHSAERNVLSAVAEASGFDVDRCPAPWQRHSCNHGLTGAEQEAFARAFSAFEKRIEEEADGGPPLPASAYLSNDPTWTPLLNQIFTYISGAALDDIDAADYARYEDTGVNWRVREGYGALIAACGRDLPARLETHVREIALGASGVRVKTSRGEIEARCAILTAPTSAYRTIRFTPDLPEKRAAAEALPLGPAEKLFFALSHPEEFPVDGHLFGSVINATAGSYHLRPLGRALIEVFYGATLARGLAEAGADAMEDYARQELASLLGARFPMRLARLAASSWSVDPATLGGYSYAKPGCADYRSVLAAPVDDRVFFAGEACSRDRYSTAHGAFQTGYEAGDAALQVINCAASTSS